MQLQLRAEKLIFPGTGGWLKIFRQTHFYFTIIQGGSKIFMMHLVSGVQ